VALTANIAAIASVYVNVACPARDDATAHDTATNNEPAISAA
jgi:hypothetical protein